MTAQSWHILLSNDSNWSYQHQRKMPRQKSVTRDSADAISHTPVIRSLSLLPTERRECSLVNTTSGTLGQLALLCCSVYMSRHMHHPPWYKQFQPQGCGHTAATALQRCLKSGSVTSPSAYMRCWLAGWPAGPIACMQAKRRGPAAGRLHGLGRGVVGSFHIAIGIPNVLNVVLNAQKQMWSLSRGSAQVGSKAFSNSRPGCHRGRR
ncbi:hypothetical protein BD289DRAFT_437330 [Coniella lustricola]|uniref:Uncharacterized protein n=1 Tax=Coniella lustricola TaxID=2025994 RepID=A0A2T3A490_9PEZI|nr:hypothetical protein BD289DRAFT_437330 [Coniella lustricola]